MGVAVKGSFMELVGFEEDGTSKQITVIGFVPNEVTKELVSGGVIFENQIFRINETLKRITNFITLEFINLSHVNICKE